MVRALHDAGLEVILDVVFNHTAEGNEAGPTLCLRGFDNAVYYRLFPHNRAQYKNFTGCGNTVNFDDPEVRALVIDCLRYWVDEMRVDGFRFDLAPIVGRDSARLQPQCAVLRGAALGPGARLRQADRRALGRRPRRLPARPLPGRLVGVERSLPRHDARVLARRPRR